MVTVPGRRETRALLDRHGLRPRLSYGQHFVTDPNTVRKMVRLAGVQPGDLVVEVGPGLGALTAALVEAGADVVAVENDRTLEPALAETLRGTRARVVWADALAVDWDGVTEGRRAKMVSNLPYNVATPLLIEMLVARPEIEEYTVMVQKEVGERLVARPGEEAYGGVSVKVAYLAEGEVAAPISRRVFLPEPKVDSVVVRLRRRAEPPVEADRAQLFAVVDAGFGQRRKTIRNALRGAGLDAPVVEEALAAAGVEPGARAETLGLDRFAALARALPPLRGGRS